MTAKTKSNSLLKFITCGSVDDGKSTLIGHILYDTKLLYTDQKRALELESRVGSRGGEIDYSLLLDGLMAEREQGITIDVAYRYFSTERRSFIVADTPGHEEYTRNMAVGASFADLAVILIDASKGVLVQTRRHARICALMGIRYFVFAVNKMDLVEYRQAPFEGIRTQIRELQEELGLENVTIIPLCATDGENLTGRSWKMPWYGGVSLLEYLETVKIEGGAQEAGFYMPVQRVCRPDHTFRGFQGQIEAGSVRRGDTITVLPSGSEAVVSEIFVGDKEVEEAVRGQPVTIRIDREIDISRGSVLSKGTGLRIADHFEATLLWMDNSGMTPGRDLFAKIGTRLIPCRVTGIRYLVDVNTGVHRKTVHLMKNDIALCVIELTQPVVLDRFASHRAMGELILIDRITNATSACGVIEVVYDSEESTAGKITSALRAHYMGQKPYIILTGSRERAHGIERELLGQGYHTMSVPLFDENLVTAADILWQAGVITVAYEGEPDSPQGAPGAQPLLPALVLLKKMLPGAQILDLRTGGPEEDRMVYENMVNYVLY